MTTDNNKTIARAITDKRLLARKNQEEVAEALGVSTASISNWERGLNQPFIKRIWQLADYYNCSIDELVGRNTS